MKIEVWSDVVCPWCYLGKRRLEHALERFADRAHVEVVWRSFQLQPDAPRFGEPGAGRLASEHLADKYPDPGRIRSAQAQLAALLAEEGIEYRFEQARYVNTFDAHRLIQWSAERGPADALVERLFQAQHVDGLRIDDRETLVRLAAEVGLPATAAAAALEGEAAGDAVRTDVLEAHRLGIAGVPCFVVDRRLAVSGAQPVELLVDALEQAGRDMTSA
jgi:predicted DsbA family dithiol-disulfide isomerase